MDVIVSPGDWREATPLCSLMNSDLFFTLFQTLQVVGESGLFTPDDIAYVQESGVRAVSCAGSLT